MATKTVVDSKKKMLEAQKKLAQQQIKKLDFRLGVGEGAAKERKKLQERVDHINAELRVFTE
jgi:hypothetical protein